MRWLLVAGWLAALAPVGRIDTAAGSGQAGYSGDGASAADAGLNQPFHCDIDPEGNLLIAEAFNHCIRKVDTRTGRIATVAGTGKKGYTGDGGPATRATFNEPYAVVADRNGDLYVVDRLNAVVRKVDGATGRASTVAGTGQKDFAGDGGPGTKALLREPNDCCLDDKGGLLIADVADWRIRRLDLTTGVITTFAGTGRVTGKVDRERNGDGNQAAQAVIVGARAVCADGRGNVYICEREGNAIRKVDSRGVIQTFAGTGQKGYTGDGGPALKATFNGPKGVRCDREGNLFVVDTENHAIRRIDAKSGIVTTAAGGRKGGAGDGGPANKAELDRPHGCILDARGILYIADSNNHRVRRVTPE